MIRLISSLLLLTLGAFANAALAQYADLPEEAIYDTPERRHGHLQYFGFYASAMNHWNFTAELAPFTNLTWIRVGTADDPDAALDEITSRMLEARAAGVRAVIDIESFLFLNDRGDPRPDADIEEFLVELRARLEVDGLLDTLLMLYPKDEPFREFVRYRDPSFQDQYITGEIYAEIYADLSHVNALVKLVFPDKPIGVILSGYEISHRFFSIPVNYDWVGFDCYDELFRSCDDRSFVQHYVQLLEHMQPHQQLMAVPETWVQNENLDRADWPDVLMSRLRHHYEIALNEPRFVAFIPFIWSFDAEGDVPGMGLNRFEEHFNDGVNQRGTAFVDAVKRIGEEIKHRKQVYPNMAWSETEDSRHRPPSNIRGEIMSITSGGLLSAWAIDDALLHKNLRVQVVVRDVRGNLVHKSVPERTFVLDRELDDAARIGRGNTGTHGFRYQLPPAMVKSFGGRPLNFEFFVYADGAERAIGYISNRYVSMGRTVYSPLSLPPPRWPGRLD